MDCWLGRYFGFRPVCLLKQSYLRYNATAAHVHPVQVNKCQTSGRQTSSFIPSVQILSGFAVKSEQVTHIDVTVLILGFWVLYISSDSAFIKIKVARQLWVMVSSTFIQLLDQIKWRISWNCNANFWSLWILILCNQNKISCVLRPVWLNSPQ